MEVYRRAFTISAYSVYYHLVAKYLFIGVGYDNCLCSE